MVKPPWKKFCVTHNGKENLSDLYISSIRCSTADVNSKGNAYAGGLIAYSNNSNVYWNNIENKTLYKTNVYIEAEVNGLGSAFAGGIFGYSPVIVDNSTLKEIVLNKEDFSKNFLQHDNRKVTKLF